MSSVPASAYIVELSGEIDQQEDHILALYAVARDAEELAEAFHATMPDDRLPELLARVVAAELELGIGEGPRYELRLWTVQAGKLHGPPVQLRPHVRIIDGDRRVRLDRLDVGAPIDEADLEFELVVPPLAPLAAPVLELGQHLQVLVPEELEDMTDLEFGENHIMFAENADEQAARQRLR